jgi:hypothetical protein
VPRESRARFYAATLVAGSLTVGIAGLGHPMLVGDGAGQLTLIAATPAWRAIHWAFAAGYVAVVAGLAGLAAAHAGTAGDRAARIGALTTTFGYAVSLVGVLFMLGGAAALADAYVRGAPGLAATHAVFVYDMLHPSAQAAVRAGSGAVSLGLYAFGWGVARGGVLPRWLGLAAVASGVAGVAAAVLAAPDTAALVAGVALATLWQAVAGVVVLVGARRESRA